MGRSSHRRQIPAERRRLAIKRVADRLEDRLIQKGQGTWSSRHEILGVVTEEYHELLEAVHSGRPEEIGNELEDLAVAAVFGLACLAEGSLDW